ncbi:MAG: pirin family protein [Microthrixaceae bacterium]
MTQHPVLQSFELGPQWPTIDPFLFCAHHNDAYPQGDAQFGPSASLEGRQMGSDFAGKDGWRMYHGSRVPGFPQHPHRGFETVTFVRTGLIDHSDSLGAAARFGAGDVQWLTAGSGIVHSEMFPLLSRNDPNPVELFQIWLNLPAEDKMVDPHFTMLWNQQIPRVLFVDAEQLTTEVTVIAGSLAGTAAESPNESANPSTASNIAPPQPPPNSWAAQHESEVAIWSIRMQAGSTWTLPAATGPDTTRVLYFFEGGSLAVAGEQYECSTGLVIAGDCNVELAAGAEAVELLLLQGRPIGEPVAQYGPFVMNTRAQLEQAFDDYRRTEFGGWPWPEDGPVHGADPQRFARHVDGRLETPS